MTQKDKVKVRFLENPKSVSYQKILTFLKSEGYVTENRSSSHVKIIHPDFPDYYVTSPHGNEVENYQKKDLRDLYISHFPQHD